METAILSKFPPGSRLISETPHGNSKWAKPTIEPTLLTVILPDESRHKYFLKRTSSAEGREMTEGEYESMSEIYKLAPNFVPKPHSWGICHSVDGEEIHFFIQEFIEMTTHILPDPEKLCRKLSSLHKASVPGKNFGFHVQTSQGRTLQAVNTKFPTWTPFFTHILKHITEVDMSVNGHWVSLATLESRIFTHVIPRLIGILEEKGREIKPCLIHGDLWEGIIGTVVSTGDIVVFDATSYYAHHEMEVANWRCHYNKIHDERYTRTYLKYYQPSEPREEWEDRNRMYCIYYNILYSVNDMDQGMAVRQTNVLLFYLLSTTCIILLISTPPFPTGEGPPRLIEAERVGLSAVRDHTKV
ncbi:hypothetical protein HYALB_00001874 [Hymenoscyphus albidus]|uniref:protein-ribulosamine 3-kinase n=1 Tax=Hymenoscyphus albidus TaxID=595503 RepID=A0A9N9LSZ3_9HELO|nr:hypothetical protein HYALB_00001874 [Hymenoscyphus albidus]